MALYTIEQSSGTLNFVVAAICLEHSHTPDLSNTLHMKNTHFKIIVFMDVTSCCPGMTLWRDFLHLHSTVKIATAWRAIPVQVWMGPECSRRLKLQDMTIFGTWRWLGCQPDAPATFTPQEIFLALMSVRGWVDSRAIVWPEGCQWQILIRPSGNQICALPACSAVPHTNVPVHAPR
jgi:hypothetical protein